MQSLYIGFKHVVPSTNTKFKLTSQAGHIPYTNIYKQRISYFKSTLTFLGPAKRWKSISADIEDFFVLQE